MRQQPNCMVDNKTRLNSHLRTSSWGSERLRSTSCASSSREQTSRGSCIRPRNFERTQENSANVTKHLYTRRHLPFDLQSKLASVQLIQSPAINEGSHSWHNSNSQAERQRQGCSTGALPLRSFVTYQSWRGLRLVSHFHSGWRSSPS